MKVFTVPMRLLTAVVLDEHSEAVKRQLLSLGLLDFVKITHLAPEEAAKFKTDIKDQETQAYSTLRVRIETLFEQAHIPLPSTEALQPDSVEEVDLKRSHAFIDTISDDLTSWREKQKQVNQNRMRIEELLLYLKEEKYHYIDLFIGHPEKGDAALIEQRLAALAHCLVKPDEFKDLVLLTLKRDKTEVHPLLETVQWIENTDRTLEKEAYEALKECLSKKLEQLDADNRDLKEKIHIRISTETTPLKKLWENLKLQELLSLISDNFSYTRNTTIFSGWVPLERSEEVEQTIRQKSQNACVIEWTDAQQVPRQEIPVAVEDVPILRPFQKIVDNYSTPEYGSINPTPFVAISYLTMYGLMFADAGQGLIILLIGLIGRYLLGKSSVEKHRLISLDLYKLFVYLGASSIVAGIIFGSYFGFPLFKPLWFDYHGAVVGHEGGGRNVYTILGITIWFGVIIIGLGLLLNWINLVRKRDWFHLFMDKNGVIGGWLFAIGIWAATAFVKSGYKSFPQGNFLTVGFALPLILLFGKIPFMRYTQKKGGKEVEKRGIGALIMDSVLEWIVDVLEIFAGFLANTLSFMRVAGLGIAHVSLMVAFSEMAALTNSTIGTIFILIIGNALVIALEGLSAGIQALRLNYYEFFTKYFTGRGLSYNPISLRQK